MKAAFALLPDSETSNIVRKAAWEINRQFRTGVSARRLPPHISLKQPFDIEDLDALEVYMGEFARSIEPFTLELVSYNLWEYPAGNPTSGILTIQVRETDILRGLHNQLNQELAERFGERRADFDGDAYAFHLTVAAGVGSVESYRAAFAAYANVPVARSFQTRELTLFVYDTEEGSGDWQFLTYTTLPLGNGT